MPGEEEWPQFFKVVFSPVSQGVRIPTTFMEAHGHSLSNYTVVLKIPATGASWSVQLRRDDYGTWLGGSGWPEFAAYYGIEACHFLVFKYPGNALFHVTIFDPDGAEIEYRMEQQQQATVDQPGTMLKAQAFRSENPFFVRLMTPSVVGKNYCLTFSPRFLGSEIPVREKSCLLKLHVPGNAKVWILKYNMYRKGETGTVCGGGWKSFALDNNLQIEDVCIFEQLEGTHLHFNVTIFRNT